MSKEGDRQSSQWQVMMVLVGTIVVVYIVSQLLSRMSTVF